MKLSATEKYLRDWAEPEVRVLERLLTGSNAQSANTAFNRSAQATQEAVIIVPAFDEPPAWWQRYSQALADHKICWIWVFNAPDNLADTARYQQQATAYAQCLNQLQAATTLGALTLGQLTPKHTVLLVDRFSQPLPHRQGVGLARKIGNDLGLTLIHRGLVSTPWLINTDADVELPTDLLSHKHVQRRFKEPDLAAFLFGFEHTACDTKYAESTWCYDQYLHYHCRGLGYAASPYAYPTIGSLIAASASHYAAVRGFPKQAAGEDFYLLNKLRKLSPVRALTQPVITVSGRPSHRVPYGTGPALTRWQSQNRWETQVWSPAVYEALKNLLHCMTEIFAAARLPTEPCPCANTLLTSLPDESARILADLGFTAWFDRAIQWPQRAQQQRRDKCHLSTPTTTLAQRRIQTFHNWFDGLKTQQFIRRQAANYPSISIAEAANCFPSKTPEQTLGMGM